MKVDYLGLLIEEGKISMDPIKLKGIADWPAPMTIKQVRSFLGFGNYYWRFIHGYGDLTNPLNNLLRKEENFNWNKEQQETFDKLKRNFQEAPVLQMPDPRKPFVVQTDASKFASGLRRHLTATRHEQWLAPLQLHIQVIQWNRTKLWDLWPRTTGNHPSTHQVATLSARIPTPDHNSLWPQKPHVLQDHSETEQTTSKMASHFIWIRHQAYPCAWKADGPIRHTIMTTWSMPWWRHW